MKTKRIEVERLEAQEVERRVAPLTVSPPKDRFFDGWCPED